MLCYVFMLCFVSLCYVMLCYRRIIIIIIIVLRTRPKVLRPPPDYIPQRTEPMCARSDLSELSRVDITAQFLRCHTSLSTGTPETGDVNSPLSSPSLFQALWGHWQCQHDPSFGHHLWWPNQPIHPSSALSLSLTPAWPVCFKKWRWQCESLTVMAATKAFICLGSQDYTLHLCAERLTEQWSERFTGHPCEGRGWSPYVDQRASEDDKDDDKDNDDFKLLAMMLTIIERVKSSLSLSNFFLKALFLHEEMAQDNDGSALVNYIITWRLNFWLHKNMFFCLGLFFTRIIIF